MKRKSIIVASVAAFACLLAWGTIGTDSAQASSCFDTCAPTCDNWECRSIGLNGKYCYPLGLPGNPCKCCDNLFQGTCNTDNGQCGS